jgi:hypothetical protein
MRSSALELSPVQRLSNLGGSGGPPPYRSNGANGGRQGLNGTNCRHKRLTKDITVLVVWNRIVGFEKGQYLISRFKDLPARGQNFALTQHDPLIKVLIHLAPRETL